VWDALKAPVHLLMPHAHLLESVGKVAYKGLKTGYEQRVRMGGLFEAGLRRAICTDPVDNARVGQAAKDILRALRRTKLPNKGRIHSVIDKARFQNATSARQIMEVSTYAERLGGWINIAATTDDRVQASLGGVTCRGQPVRPEQIGPYFGDALADELESPERENDRVAGEFLDLLAQADARYKTAEKLRTQPSLKVVTTGAGFVGLVGGSGIGALIDLAAHTATWTGPVIGASAAVLTVGTATTLELMRHDRSAPSEHQLAHEGAAELLVQTLHRTEPWRIEEEQLLMARLVTALVAARDGSDAVLYNALWEVAILFSEYVTVLADQYGWGPFLQESSVIQLTRLVRAAWPEALSVDGSQGSGG